MILLLALLQVRVHSREGSIRPVTDVLLDRDGAEWPPRLSAMDRAEIMRPEAMRSERQLLEEPVQGAPSRHLLVSACTMNRQFAKACKFPVLRRRHSHLLSTACSRVYQL